MASLASLLNPSDSDGRQSPPAATQQMPRKDSLPPIQPVQSHGSAHTLSPGSTRSGPQQFAVSSTAQEAAQALASLSTSPAPPPTQWNGYSAQDGGNLERQRSWDRASVQLPPPTPIDATRKNSSPTLEQYHFASSHSPDQRRESTATPRSPNIVLPPLQGIVPDQVQRQSHGSAQESLSVSAHQLQTDRPSASLKATGQAHSATVISSTDNLATLSPAVPAQLEGVTSFVAMEVVPAAQLSPPPDDRASDVDAHVLKAVATLKSENIQRTQSPLRETSVPVSSTEDSVKDEPAVTTKKRPAPAKTKKGTASTVKKDKAPPAKKRRVDTKRADTPSSRASKAAAGKSASVKGTPINSSPAPSIRSYSAEPEEQDDEDDEMDDDGRSQDGDLYCICRKPDNGQFMIGCDGTCDDWFHGKCVGVPERDKNLIDKYICPGCTTKGVGRTTWKRMCRRSGCRQPAKTGKNRNGAHGSKYCSEECGVLYFREMVVKTRGAEESASRSAARRKGSLSSLDKQDEDVGARGGALAAGEVKALLNVSSTAEDFRKLGDGVLSPPATPDGNCEKDLPEFSEHEARELEHIEMEKEIARLRHTLLKDRMKFVTLAKQAASRVATERELKPKEYCGYDPRIEWSEQRFQRWRTSKTGRQAFELDTLAIEKIGTEDDTMVDEEPMPDICDRKKCARHMEWSKLAVDDIRFEMSDNGDRMRSLDRDEHDIKERAALRSKTGALNDGGSVEVHGLGITTACQENKETGAQPANSPDVVPTVEAGDPMAVDVL